MTTPVAEHDVWVSDWIDARMVPLTAGPFHLDDYVDYVRDWITLLSPDLHVISVCQPTVPVLAAVALYCIWQVYLAVAVEFAVQRQAVHAFDHARVEDHAVALVQGRCRAELNQAPAIAGLVLGEMLA